MKSKRFVFVVMVLLLTGSMAQAQFNNRLNNAVRNAAENAAIRQAERRTEEAVDKAIDNAFEKTEEQRARGEAELEKALDRAVEGLEEAQRAQEEADAQADKLIGEIPEVGNAPYTPSESEYAFFSMKKGNVQVYATKDAKGKITGQTRNTIKEITGEPNAFAIHYQSEVLDAKGNPTDKKNPLVLNYRIVVKDGVMYLDMKGMFGAMDGLEGVQVSGTTMKIPNNLAAGQRLDDAAARVRIGFINCSAVMTEGQCLAIEDVAVEVATFRCHKVSQKVNSTAIGIRNEGTTLTWYAKGVGAIKTESYDKNGKLVSVQELISNL
jgi:ElaB/YqjD/DUF883 family membrane-anchored ribosome-binding protein